VIRVGHPLLDAYVELVTARARWNTVLATAFDLKVFFSIVDKDPVDVTTADVLEFIKVQRTPRVAGGVVRIEDGEAGLSARTIKRRLATIAGLYEYLIIRSDAGVSRNPVPRGLAMRRPGQRAVRGVPLIRAPRTLPRVIDPDDVDALVGALRTDRDRAMVEAMLLGGLRRCEVLGLRVNGHRERPTGGHEQRPTDGNGKSPRTAKGPPQGRPRELPADGLVLPAGQWASGTTPLPDMASARRTDSPSVTMAWAWCMRRSTRAAVLL